MSNMIICGKQCEDCVHATIFDDRKAAKVYCAARDKEYYYGARIPCDDYKQYVSYDEKVRD